MYGLTAVQRVLASLLIIEVHMTWQHDARPLCPRWHPFVTPAWRLVMSDH